MGLSAREQQALDSIEGRLADSDPKLASLLATFTRLASGERMPVREAIRPASWRATSRRRRKRCRWQVGAGQPTRKIRLGWQWAMLVLAVATTLAAVSLAANRDGSQGTCHTSGVAACAGQAPGQGSRTTAHTMPLGLMLPATAGSHPAPPPVPASASPIQAAPRGPATWVTPR